MLDTWSRIQAVFVENRPRTNLSGSLRICRVDWQKQCHAIRIQRPRPQWSIGLLSAPSTSSASGNLKLQTFMIWDHVAVIETPSVKRTGNLILPVQLFVCMVSCRRKYDFCRSQFYDSTTRFLFLEVVMTAFVPRNPGQQGKTRRCSTSIKHCLAVAMLCAS